MRVLIAETDQQLARERARHLQMDGHQTSLALASHAAAVKLAELPDALVLCNLASPVQTDRAAARAPRRRDPGQRPEPGGPRRRRRGRPRPGPLLPAGADIALPAASSPLLIAAALAALARRTGADSGAACCA